MLNYIPTQPVSILSSDASTAPDVRLITSRQAPNPAIAVIKAAARRLSYTSEVAALPPWSLSKDVIQKVITKVALETNDRRPPHWTTVVRWHRRAQLKPKRPLQIPSGLQVDHAPVDLAVSDRRFGAPRRIDPRQKSSIERAFAQLGPTMARRLRLRDLPATVVMDRGQESMSRRLREWALVNRINLEHRDPPTRPSLDEGRNSAVSRVRCEGGFLEIQVTVDPRSRAITEMRTRFVPSNS